jgi:hypothetical protein
MGPTAHLSFTPDRGVKAASAVSDTGAAVLGDRFFGLRRLRGDSREPNQVEAGREEHVDWALATTW